MEEDGPCAWQVGAVFQESIFVSRHEQDIRRNKRRARWSGSSSKLVLEHVRWVSQNCTSRFKATNGVSCAVEGSPGTMQMKS